MSPRLTLASRRGDDRQPDDRPHARPLAPSDLGGVDRQRELRPAAKQRLQRTGALDARELVTEAEMNPGTEGDVPVRSPREIERLGLLIRLRVEVRGRQHGHDLVVFAQPYTAELNVLAHDARLGELHR